MKDEKLQREGFYKKKETEEPFRREEIHIDKDGNISTSISKDEKHGSASSREKQPKLTVVGFESIEDLDESLDAIIAGPVEDDGGG